MRQTVTCPNCGAQSAGLKFCTNCGAGLPAATSQQVEEAQPTPITRPAGRETVSQKYGVLRAAAIIYKIIGWVICAGGSLFSIAAAVMAAQGVTFFENLVPEFGGVVGVDAAVIGIGGVIISILGGLFLLAFAELCSVAMDIAQNTRQEE